MKNGTKSADAAWRLRTVAQSTMFTPRYLARGKCCAIVEVGISAWRNGVNRRRGTRRVRVRTEDDKAEIESQCHEVVVLALYGKSHDRGIAG